MATNGVKTYSIKINGIQESIDAVSALNKQLSNLEQRINVLSSAKSVGTKVSGGGGTSSSSKSSLSEEEKLEKQIEQIDAKRVAYSKEIYQNYLAAKDILKETVQDQKQLAASERLSAGNYSNTMAGMKQELADIKSVMQTVDLGDTDQFDKLTQRANKLNDELKKIEESYGQFGRNVGNYKDAFKGIALAIGDTTEEFDNAKQALKTLKGEMRTLSVKKDMGIISKEEEDRLKNLIPVVGQLESSINDAGKPMDNLLDAMQSFVAITQSVKGLSTFFGIDSTEIDKTIKNLVALQNAMQGLQTIQKQLQTQEGIGKWIAPFNAGIDKATTKVLALNTAVLGTGKAAKVAAVSINVFSKALKVAFTGGVMIAISLLIDALMDLIENFNKVDEEAERIKNTQKEISEAYGEAQGKLIQYSTTVNNFNGTSKQEKKLVEELNREFGSTLGTYKSLSEWKDVLRKKGEAYIQVLVKQAKVQAALNEVTAAYMNLENVKQKAASGEYKHWYQTQQQDLEAAARAIESANERITKAEENLTKSVNELSDYQEENKLGDFAPQIEKNTGKTQKALEEEKRILDSLELRLMRDSLAKKLRQMDEEERQTIQKLQENGRKSADAVKRIHNYYTVLRLNQIKDYLKDTETLIKDTQKNIDNFQFQLNIDKIENQIDKLKNEFSELPSSTSVNTPITASYEVKGLLKDYGVSEESFDYAKQFQRLFNERRTKEEIDKYYDFLRAYMEKKKKSLSPNDGDLFFGSDKDFLKQAEADFEDEYKKELQIVRNYTNSIDETLASSISTRFMLQDKYSQVTLKKITDNLNKQKKLTTESLKEQEKAASEAEETRYQNAKMPLEKRKAQLEEDIKNFKARNGEEEKLLAELKVDLANVEAEMETQRQQHYDKLEEINKDYTEKIKKNEIDTNNAISAEQEKSFDEQIRNITDAQSKINDLLSNQPQYNLFGIVNIKETKRQYKELENATTVTINKIIAERQKLNQLWKAGLLTPAAMMAIQTQLNNLEASVRKTFQAILDVSNETIPKFVQSCQVYLQGAMDSFMDIMSAVWDAQDNANDKEAERLDKLNEIIEQKLDEQEAIIDKHKNNVDSIEDELASARGDRRQHLIDQLNAEMQAQREAAAEQKRLEKEKEALERKQDDLEKKRKKQQYHRDMIQAIVNGAMAVTMAAVNKWPIPAIPMMALAASTTAAQIAIMAANKPYAKGGLLEGPSHSQGGIPVGNTGIEVEGKEYVIRKSSTAPNIEILDYINKSERKLNLDDFIDFYSSGKLKKNIVQMSPRSRFANGGSLPTISTNYSFDDRLLTAFEDYSNRPVVVSVKDINDRQTAVRNVQVLAGLSD